MIKRADHAGRLLLGHPREALVELREPRADARDGEHQRADADERVAQRRDLPDRAEVVAQPADHVADELAEAGLEQLDVLDFGVVVRGARVDVHAIAGAALRFLQRVREARDDEARRADDEERGPPSELRADRAAERDAEPEPDEHHHLLVREDAAAPAGRVVVGEQARRRRFGDRLPEAEQRARYRRASPKLVRGRGQHRDEAPAHDRVTDGAAAVPPVGEVARGHGDEPVHEDERRQQHADLRVVDVEVVLDLADDAAHDVLVDLVDHDHHAEDPHGPARDVRFVARARSAHQRASLA